MGVTTDDGPGHNNGGNNMTTKPDKDRHTTPKTTPLGDQTPTVNCPYCDREGPAEYGLNLCSGCSSWFIVEQGDA